MILKRFYDEKLAQASYLVGCAATGEALVIDPLRDVEGYIRTAEEEELRITHVTETHIHADFVSGVRELANRTGATLYLSNEGGADWKYQFPSADGTVLLKDGDTFSVGNVKVEALHTPGHTPEHLAFRVTDSAGASQPMGIFTGDFIFVGDVGRPDLLEKAAKMKGTMEGAARALFHSLQKIKSQPDYLQIWPGHGAGSACGKALGAVPQSTFGYEKMFNWAFGHEKEEEFMREVLADQPEPPKYFAEMKRINKEGPQIVGGFRRPQRLAESRLAELLDSDALIVDTRHPGDYAKGHIPGTINIPLGRSFTNWAGWLLPYDREFYLIVAEDGDGRTTDEVARDLVLIGLDRVAGYFSGSVVQTWAGEGRALGTTQEITAEELVRRSRGNGIAVVDVRGLAEWEAGHIPGVAHIPLGYLLDRVEEVPNAAPVVLQCSTGWRSAIGASLLQARGYENTINLKGGIQAWLADGNELERG